MNFFCVTTLLLTLIASTPVHAPREWVKEEDHVNGRISRTKLAKMQSAADAMVTFLQDSCFSEVDFTPLWHGEYFSEKFSIQCRSEDNKSQLTIMAGDMSPLLRFLTVNGKEIAGIRPADGVQKDCPYFEYESEDHQHSITWLVTGRDGQLPYIPVTRKEYLQEARAELTAIKNGIITNIRLKTPVRPATVQAAEKQAAIDQLHNNYSGTDLQVRMRLLLQNYQSDDAYLQSNITKATADLDRTLRLMDSISLRSTPADLNRAAMVSVAADSFRGFEDNAADRNMLIRMNPDYFKTHSVNGNARLFLVRWSYDPSASTIADIDRQVRENIDFRQLQDMLGK